MRVVSLSSIPPRFKYLQETLQSLLAQPGVDEIRLNIPIAYKRFPNYDGRVPEVPEGVKLCVVDEDLGPATKLLPTLQAYRGQNVQILFCDDDGFFPLGWAKRLFEAQAKRSDEAVATVGRSVEGYIKGPLLDKPKPQAKQIDLGFDIQYRMERLLARFSNYQPLHRPIISKGYVDILFGSGGAVVRPSFFDEDVFDIPNDVWLVDDIWLSANLAKTGTNVYCPFRFPCPVGGEAHSCSSLLDLVYEGEGRQLLNRKAVKWCKENLGIWQTCD